MLLSKTEVEGVNPTWGSAQLILPLKHLQIRFIVLALNSLCLPRIALVNQISPYFFLPTWAVTG